VAVCVGALALTAIVVVPVSLRFKPISDWEVKAVDRLMPERRVLRTRTVVVARPS
jgi:hypothetical protein